MNSCCGSPKMNTANPVVRVTLLLSALYKRRLFAEGHKKSKHSSKETSGAVLTLRYQDRHPEEACCVCSCSFLCLTVGLISQCPGQSLEEDLGDEEEWVGGRRGLGRENIFSNAGQQLSSGPCTTTDHSYPFDGQVRLKKEALKWP